MYEHVEVHIQIQILFKRKKDPNEQLRAARGIVEEKKP